METEVVFFSIGIITIIGYIASNIFDRTGIPDTPFLIILGFIIIFLPKKIIILTLIFTAPTSLIKMGEVTLFKLGCTAVTMPLKEWMENFQRKDWP